MSLAAKRRNSIGEVPGYAKPIVCTRTSCVAHGHSHSHNEHAHESKPTTSSTTTVPLNTAVAAAAAAAAAGIIQAQKARLREKEREEEEKTNVPPPLQIPSAHGNNSKSTHTAAFHCLFHSFLSFYFSHFFCYYHTIIIFMLLKLASPINTRPVTPRRSSLKSSPSLLALSPSQSPSRRVSFQSSSSSLLLPPSVNSHHHHPSHMTRSNMDQIYDTAANLLTHSLTKYKTDQHHHHHHQQHPNSNLNIHVTGPDGRSHLVSSIDHDQHQQQQQLQSQQESYQFDSSQPLEIRPEEKHQYLHAAPHHVPFFKQSTNGTHALIHTHILLFCFVWTCT